MNKIIDFFKDSTVVIISLFVFPPLGIFLLWWACKDINIKRKIILTVLSTCVLVALILSVVLLPKSGNQEIGNPTGDTSSVESIDETIFEGIGYGESNDYRIIGEAFSENCSFADPYGKPVNGVMVSVTVIPPKDDISRTEICDMAMLIYERYKYYEGISDMQLKVKMSDYETDIASIRVRLGEVCSMDGSEYITKEDWISGIKS